MAASTPDDPPRITPYLAYQDAPAALRFLCEAFGFEERFRHPMPDGRIGHAELAYAGQSAVWLASAYPEMGLQSPRQLGAVHSQVHCYVDDVDAHYARSLAAGATVIAAPEDQPHGDRSYRAVDPEGHRWIFASRLRR
jgi:PhnB protein